MPELDTGISGKNSRLQVHDIKMSGYDDIIYLKKEDMKDEIFKTVSHNPRHFIYRRDTEVYNSASDPGEHIWHGHHVHLSADKTDQAG